ncbi:glucose-1-phosphate thymidylyltransferase RfbA [Campylobacter curvus]|uniref:Glucose-1-phosphate thymidylyltransferase n=1 Tax=Campylobacter curvus (strain 525.92) TaxID=360105 RepID=A7GZ41_CAMC5|nr:glucose-1-phosphate thymidylyltransferase RfbA [Campylobacter curvus]EAU00054.1 glucose-1-phosphate thymidylyltransferase [Campylobacter curvus 525.92]
MKGIVLAGGTGTRLYPITISISKQLAPVYDKPMIYYPLSVLMLAGIREILIICAPNDINSFKRLLGDGSSLGINLTYKEQPKPDGLAQAFIIGSSFINNDNVCMILGDNIFYGQGLSNLLQKSIEIVESNKKSIVFAYQVKDPERYGVVEFDDGKKVLSIVEKPLLPKSNYALVGLYFFTNDVVRIAKEIKPSSRGELEITDVMQQFLNINKLNVELLGRGFAWLDTGTHESLLEASNFVQVVEKRQGLKIACIEEVAYNMGYIKKEQLIKLAYNFKNNQYGEYLIKIAEGKVI